MKVTGSNDQSLEDFILLFFNVECFPPQTHKWLEKNGCLNFHREKNQPYKTQDTYKNIRYNKYTFR